MTSPPGEDAGPPAPDDRGTAQTRARSSSASAGGEHRASARTGAAKSRGRSGSSAMPLWKEMLWLLASAVILALILKTFFVQAFYIPSGSMRDTLKIDDRILVQKVSYWFGDVDRGDIVVFDDPANWLGDEGGQEPESVVTKGLAAIGLYPTGGHLVKRVIGVGGDRVECTKSGVIEVNSTALDEEEYVTLPKNPCRTAFDVKVPAEHIWVMGDNRNHSADSRVHTGDPGGGYIPVDDVVGKVFVVVWPPDRWKLVQRPDSFDEATLDAWGGLALPAVPLGLALVVSPPLYRRWKDTKGMRR